MAFLCLLKSFICNLKGSFGKDAVRRRDSRMKDLLKYMKKHWVLYLIGVISICGGLYLDLNNPIITGRIIDEVIVEGNLGIFKRLILMMIGITVGRAIFGYIKEMSFDYGGMGIAVRIRRNLFSHIQGLSAHFFEEKNTGELMSRVKEDVDKIWSGAAFGIMLCIEIALNLICATIFMIRISPVLSIIALIALPIIGFLAFSLEKRIGKTFELISEQNANLNTTAQENIAGVRLVKAFAREKYEISKFLKANKRYYELNIEQTRTWNRYYPKLEFLTGLLPILVITFGGALVIKENMSIGTLVKFSGYMNMIVWPMRNMGWVSNVMAEAIASVKKTNEIFSHKSKLVNKEDAVELKNFKGNIEFKNVSYCVGDAVVLDDINFEIKAGKTLGIMGETGSGKSSIMNLLVRFYDRTSGDILLDGTKIEDIDLKSLRKNISVVMQDTFLFSDTIEENIVFGSKDDITESRILESARSAQAHDFVMSMENEYHTIIGEKGIGLSGGQKQRISIARALAKQANVIIFDDSTSALDMETEGKIQKSIEELKDVTKIIIAHRISAVKKADEILILEKGKIVERGTHKELLALKGRYYETCLEQYEGAHETLSGGSFELA